MILLFSLGCHLLLPGTRVVEPKDESKCFKATDLFCAIIATLAKRYLLLCKEMILLFVLMIFFLPMVSKVPNFNFLIGSNNVPSDFSDNLSVIKVFMDFVPILDAPRMSSETFCSIAMPVEIDSSGCLLKGSTKLSFSTDNIA